MIPIFDPVFSGNERKYLKDCIDINWLTCQGDYILNFEKALADCLNKRESEPTKKRKKDAQKKNQALVDESQELDEMLLENNHLFYESETDMNLDKETPNNSDHFSSWA